MSPRRPPGQTRQTILDSARRLFGEVGYQKATIRRIAAAAHVDPALVIQYFGSKDDLLTEALIMPFDPAVVFDGLADHPDPGTELVRRALTAWEAPLVRDALLGLLRTGLSHDRAAGALSALLSRTVLTLVERHTTAADAQLRAALVGSQIGGLALGRMALRIPALANASVDELAAATGPTITRYLTGDLSER